MSYYVLFEHSPGDAQDTPLGIHITREDVNALCVFSSSKVAATARDATAPGYYLEAVAPDDVVSLAAIHGFDVVALDAYSANPVTLMRTVDAAEALTALSSYQA